MPRLTIDKSKFTEDLRLRDPDAFLLLEYLRWRHAGAFDIADEVRRAPRFPWSQRVICYKTAIFRQINLHNRATHHDALEFPNGEVVLLTLLEEGQQATVLQLPAAPREQEKPAVSRALETTDS